MKKLLIISGGTLVVATGGIYLVAGGTVTMLIMLIPVALGALSVLTATIAAKWIISKGDTFIEELAQSFQPAQAA